MRLAFCLFKYFPFGGLQRDFLRIAKECLRRGHQVDVFTMKWQGEVPPDILVHEISVCGWQNHTRAKHFVAQLTPRLMQYDLVIGFNKMPDLDIYYAADTCYVAKVRSQKNRLYRFLPRYRQWADFEESVFTNPNTQIFLLSSLQQKDFIKYYHTPISRFHLLPPGIAKDRIAPLNAEIIRRETRQECNIKQHEFLLLMVGSGFKTKGLDRVLLGYVALPDEIKKRTVIYVIGQDNPNAYLKQAKKWGVNIVFLGGRNDVPRFLLAADLLLHPAYNENTGTVILEAIAAGLPVLTTDVCGYAEYVIQAQAGIVLPSPFKQKHFNQTLSDMLLSPKHLDWKKHAIMFAKQADIYSLPERAVDFIEGLSKRPNVRFEKMMTLQGEVYRELEGRRTQRIIMNQSAYFIKQYFGVGWKEIIKNLLQFRLPVISAKNEWDALRYLKNLNVRVPEPIAYDSRGINPAKMKSYLLTQALPDSISLEDFCKFWETCPPDRVFKQRLIKEVATIAKILHGSGVNHRDFYICHFLLDITELKKSRIKLYLIDLHRAQIRKKVPKRWIIKDLAALYFSSKEIGLTRNDIFRFMKTYCNQSLRNIIRDFSFWYKVKKRGDKLYRTNNATTTQDVL